LAGKTESVSGEWRDEDRDEHDAEIAAHRPLPDRNRLPQNTRLPRSKGMIDLPALTEQSFEED